MTRPPAPALGDVLFFGAAFLAASYFTFAAVQGDHGLFRRVQLDAETARLAQERDRLAADLAFLQNKTRRLSDDYLDLDLLDEQARDMLGYLRPDEVVIR
ncbi:MAG: septum formation initiator family protein [Rhodobacteraceae bacterium]|jgi:cell division protein FtsB|nr:septum formation initiator family protein [Paracoccaceae bacterium]